MAITPIPNPEELGRKRFSDNKSARLDLYNRMTRVLVVLQDLFPSNYPKDSNTNLAVLLRTIANESSRIRTDIDNILLDKQYTTTRIQFLQQILGERLFLNKRIAPANYNDESYRDYLTSLKSAYLAGSKKSNIEKVASKFTGLDIKIRELYLEARTPLSSYDVSDTHSMIVEIMVDDILKSGKNIDQLINDLDFFINLIRPAHVLYSTRIIWPETLDINKIHDLQYGDAGGGCIPKYVYTPLSDRTLIASQVLVQGSSSGSIGQIDSINQGDFVFFLLDGTRVVTEPGPEGTSFYSANGRRILFEDLRVGDWVKLTGFVVPGRFQWWWVPPGVNTEDYSQFYPSNYKRPIYQDFVKKEMDAKGRFALQDRATPTTLGDQWAQDLLLPIYEDLRKDCSAPVEKPLSHSLVLAERMWSPRLDLPYDIPESTHPKLFGNIYGFNLARYPLTDGSGHPASTSDIHFAFDATALTDAVEYVDSSAAYVKLNNSFEYWDSSAGRLPVVGDICTFSYHYLDGTSDRTNTENLVYGLSQWQMPACPIVDSTGNLAKPSDIRLSVDGTYVSSAAIDVRPIFGHITLNAAKEFWLLSELGRIPGVDSTLTFSYYQGVKNSYTLLYDDYERHMDAYDAGSNSSSLVLDMAYEGDVDATSTIPVEGSALIGYRYRSYLLQHTSVLNSPDTLLLNNFQKPEDRASLANRQDTLNHMNLFFSGEFLQDTSSEIVLNDNYLENGLDPILKLPEGTPPFQKTYSYNPNFIYHRKLQDIRKNHQLLMYSDLLLKEFKQGGADTPLNSLCDNGSLKFGFRFTDTVDPIQECDPWIIADTYQTVSVPVVLPGLRTGVSNLRVSDIRLRDNFILRETADAGVMYHTYDSTVLGQAQNDFFLPQTIQVNLADYGYIDFPALPIVKDKMTLADPSNVEVKIRGVVYPGIIQYLDPITGHIILDNPAFFSKTDNYYVSAETAHRKFVRLTEYPEAASISLTLHKSGGGTSTSTDFYMEGSDLIWEGGSLDPDGPAPGPVVIEEGDDLSVTYDVNPLSNAIVTFTYLIWNSATVDLFDSNGTRTVDADYVYGGACPDPTSMDLSLKVDEYVSYLSDYSDGIKAVFMNPATCQVEQHVFSGPVFEMYEPAKDQISPPQAFPQALIRIRTAGHSLNPLQTVTQYEFINDPLVRIREKTFKELLPDRTFRTLKLLELLPL